MVNSVYQLGVPEPEYTGDAVTDTVPADTAATSYKLMWTNIVKGAFKLDVKYLNGAPVDSTYAFDVKVAPLGTTTKDDEFYYVILADGCEKTGDFTGAQWFTYDPATKTASSTAVDEFKQGARIAWRYDNIVVPQEKLPTLKAEVTNIPLMARARR